MLLIHLPRALIIASICLHLFIGLATTSQAASCNDDNIVETSSPTIFEIDLILMGTHLTPFLYHQQLHLFSPLNTEEEKLNEEGREGRTRSCEMKNENSRKPEGGGESKNMIRLHLRSMTFVVKYGGEVRKDNHDHNIHESEEEEGEQKRLPYTAVHQAEEQCQCTVKIIELSQPPPRVPTTHKEEAEGEKTDSIMKKKKQRRQEQKRRGATRRKGEEEDKIDSSFSFSRRRQNNNGEEKQSEVLLTSILAAGLDWVERVHESYNHQKTQNHHQFHQNQEDLQSEAAVLCHDAHGVEKEDDSIPGTCAYPPRQQHVVLTHCITCQPPSTLSIRQYILQLLNPLLLSTSNSSTERKEGENYYNKRKESLLLLLQPKMISTCTIGDGDAYTAADTSRSRSTSPLLFIVAKGFTYRWESPFFPRRSPDEGEEEKEHQKSPQGKKMFPEASIAIQPKWRGVSFRDARLQRDEKVEFASTQCMMFSLEWYLSLFLSSPVKSFSNDEFHVEKEMEEEVRLHRRVAPFQFSPSGHHLDGERLKIFPRDETKLGEDVILDARGKKINEKEGTVSSHRTSLRYPTESFSPLVQELDLWGWFLALQHDARSQRVQIISAGGAILACRNIAQDPLLSIFRQSSTVLYLNQHLARHFIASSSASEPSSSSGNHETGEQRRNIVSINPSKECNNSTNVNKNQSVIVPPATLLIWSFWCCVCCGFSEEIQHILLPLEAATFKDHRFRLRTTASPNCFCHGLMPHAYEALNRMKITQSDTRNALFLQPSPVPIDDSMEKQAEAESLKKKKSSTVFVDRNRNAIDPHPTLTASQLEYLQPADVIWVSHGDCHAIEGFIEGFTSTKRNHHNARRKHQEPYLQDVLEEGVQEQLGEPQIPNYIIGRVMSEFSTLPLSAVKQCNASAVAELWVPTEFSRRVFSQSGVDEKKIFVLPESVDVHFYDPDVHEPLELPLKSCSDEDVIIEGSTCRPDAPTPVATSDTKGTIQTVFGQGGTVQVKRRTKGQQQQFLSNCLRSASSDSLLFNADAEVTSSLCLNRVLDSWKYFRETYGGEGEERGQNIKKRKLQNHFKFLSAFKWEPRKGWQYLLEGYFTAFNSSDSVSLYLLTYYWEQNVELEGFKATRDCYEIMRRVEEYLLQNKHKFLPREEENEGEVTKEEPGGGEEKYQVGEGSSDTKIMKKREMILRKIWKKLPHFVIVSDALSETLMARFYKTMNAFVLPSRGEGWGRPMMQAMTMGLPTIATHWSGMVEYMNKENSFPLAVDKIDIVEKESMYGWNPGKGWAVPSVSHLISLMTFLVDPISSIIPSDDERIEEEEMKRKAKAKVIEEIRQQARRDMMEKYSEEVVATLYQDRIQKIREKIEKRRRKTRSGDDEVSFSRQSFSDGIQDEERKEFEKMQILEQRNYRTNLRRQEQEKLTKSRSRARESK